jgi:hypothetical protein
MINKKNGLPASATQDQGKAPPIWSIEAIAEEIATYRARLSEMVREHEGEFVLIKGNEVVGFFADDSLAIREGYRRFGVVPLLVKQVKAHERVVYIPNVEL